MAFIGGDPWLEGAPVPNEGIGRFEVVVDAYDCALDFETFYNLSASSYQLRNNGPSPSGTGITMRSDTRLLPKFRYVGDATKGLMLQMSIIGHRGIETLVRVTDRTSAKSPWVLIDSAGGARSVQNEDGLFPNGNTWTISPYAPPTELALYGDGYTVFSGAIPMSMVNYGTGTFLATPVRNAIYRFRNQTEEEQSHLYGDPLVPRESDTSGAFVNPQYEFIMPYRLPIAMCVYSAAVLAANARRFRFVFADKETAQAVTVETDAAWIYESTAYLSDVDKALDGAAVYYPDDLCLLRCRIGKTGIYLLSQTGTRSLDSDRFTLTRIDIL